MISELLKYTAFADAMIIDIFEQHTPLPEKAISLFSHVLNAQHIWAHRMLGLPAKYTVWEMHQPDAYRQIAAENTRLFEKVLKEVPLEKVIEYTNSAGNSFADLAKDVLFHVVNHSTYHRAQLATIFKQEGISPPATDYIMLKRKNLI